jgi:hypothetical protein
MPFTISPHPEREPKASGQRTQAVLATLFILAALALPASAETLKIGKPAPIGVPAFSELASLAKIE